MQPSAPPFLSINGGTTPAPAPKSAGFLSDIGSAIKNIFTGGSSKPAAPVSTAPAIPVNDTGGTGGSAPFLSINGGTAPAASTPTSNPLQQAATAVEDYFTPVTQKYAPSLYQQAAGQNPPPTLGQKIVGDVESIASTPAPAKVPLTATSYLTDIYGPEGTAGQGGIVGDTLQAWEKTVADIQNLPPDSASEGTKGVALAKAGLDALTAFFTPVSTVFSDLATVPGPVGDVANIVNKVFESVGAVGGDTLSTWVQNTPGLTDEEKTTLAPIAQQLGALGAQIVVGKVGDDTMTSLKTATGNFLDTISENAAIKDLNENPAVQESIANQTKPNPAVKVPVTSETPAASPPIKINTPRSQMLDYFNSQGYEPITPESELPTIQMGAKPTPTVPTVDADTPPSVPDVISPIDRYNALPADEKSVITSVARSLFGHGMDWDTAVQTALARYDSGTYDTTGKPLTITPVEPDEIPPTPPQTAPKTTITPPSEETPVQTPPARKTGVLPEIKGTGTLKERGLAKSTEAAAVEAGLTDNLGELPQYRQVNFATQASAAVKYVSENPEDAKDVAMGSKAPPRGVIAQAIFEAVKQDALLNGDIDTLRDLANSNLNIQATEAGRQIGYIGYAAKGRQIDAVSAIRDVQEARAEALKNRGVDTAKEIDTTVKQAKKATTSEATKVSRQTWDQFMQSITCGY